MVEPDEGMSTFLNQQYWSKKMEVEKEMLFSLVAILRCQSGSTAMQPKTAFSFHHKVYKKS
ncbi:hypothetical protein PanWU01x14_194750 [Parasponia andersonii]|uniref:Uncharacterized protein n=1 Tax=Parasponia andersonii TaxID=3476 RepID=A0A2P5C061_PARAD|nr:hypothetical protein PanWU01x14_194750 [Parasponia andersonii]